MTPDEYKALSNMEYWHPRWVHRGREAIAASLVAHGWAEESIQPYKVPVPCLRITAAGLDALDEQRCSGRTLTEEAE